MKRNQNEVERVGPRKKLAFPTGLAIAAVLSLGAGTALRADVPAGGCIHIASDPVQGGSVQVNASGSCPQAGSTITLTALPAAGYTFAFWSEGASGTANPVQAVAAGADPSGDQVALEAEAHFSSSGASFEEVASLDAPKDGDSVAGTVDVQVNEKSSDPLKRADFYLDGSLKKSDAQPPFDYSFDASQIGDGQHRLDVSVTDSSGLSVTKTVEFAAVSSPAISWVKVTDEVDVTVIKVGGSGFGKGSVILVNGAALGNAKYKAAQGAMVIRGSHKLDERFPSQTSVCVTVSNPSGQVSPCFNYTRP